ncbi:type I polyketide synthase [Nocardia terpenica]|uniref:type I polyketide synthase n=1 Tax=Nocardia terpenica TaxID=455432 RepID=UPI000A8A0AF2|nr:type I polyketide synthase [Nocardia terpenica]
MSVSGPGVEPIAVVGLSCRLPGAANPRALWEMLRAQRAAIRPLDGARAAAMGERPGRAGGWLDDVAGFDAEFFGIDPQEAVAMDPQQRLCLELAYQAVESAGMSRAALRGSATGVFVGTIWGDYADLLDTVDPGRYDMTGVARGILANRVSYTFDLRGPSMTVDTGQSSSLVAVHLAAESLRGGDSEIAIAGGVNLVLASASNARSVAFGALSPEGRCHTFDERADGYVRGEGGALLVLKRLDRAVADGDHVLAVLAGSAVGNDGTTGTLTTPSPDAQAEVIRAACARSGIEPAELQYVELHGTGTPVGDPIEAAGLAAAVGRSGRDPLLVGSVKTNIGHLEGAAGIAGLLKTVLAVAHGEIPASLNFRRPPATIPLAELGLRVQSETGPWPRLADAATPRYAGVSSFGMGGTNCHIVITGAPAPARTAVSDAPEAVVPQVLSTPSQAALADDTAALGDPRPSDPEVPEAVVPWVLSARSRAALAAVADGMAALGEPQWSRTEIAAGLARRDALEHRAVVLTGSGRPTADLLADLSRGVIDRHVVVGDQVVPRHSGVSGASSHSGVSGASSHSGVSGASSHSGVSGASSHSGVSGASSHSGGSGAPSHSGVSGAPSYPGVSGASSHSGVSGASSHPGVSLAGTGPVLVFPGQGAQWVGMGRALLDAPERVARVYTDRLRECSRALVAAGGPDALAVLTAAEPGGLDGTAVVQPVTWAVSVALAAVWEAAGVRPAAVIGHSQGEIAAAVVAGALTITEAAHVITARTVGLRVLAEAGTGGMLSVELGRADLEPRLAGTSLVLGAINSPAGTVVSGDLTELEALAQALRADGVRVRRVPIEYASHSPAIDAIADAVRADIGVLAPKPPRVPWLSTVTGEWMTETLPADADYWVRNLREQVRFADVVARLAEAGHTVFVECGSHPVLIGAIEQSGGTAEFGDPAVLATLRRDDGGADRLLAALAEAWVAGIDIDWAAVVSETHAVALPPNALPPYPFQHQVFWPGTVPTRAAAREPIVAAPAVPTDDAVEGATGRFARLSEEAARSEVLGTILRVTAELLGRDTAADIDAEATFRELGVDSVLSVQVRTAIGRAVGMRLASVVLFDHPTPRRLAQWLTDRLRPTGIAAETVVSAARGRTGAGVDDDPIVVVSAACRFPGGVESPEALWEVVSGGDDVLSGFPADRGWPAGLFSADPEAVGHSSVDRGGFLSGAGEFDAGFFGISPREALAMDPQQRVLLQCAWEAFERAGIDPRERTATGVFLGAMAQDYGPRMDRPAGGLDGYLLTGNATSVASGRIAYVLGLDGPALTVDTACSSSLVALHLAVRSLRDGECERALAGGATIMATPGIFVEFSRQGGLAPDGRCKPFAAAADGTGWSEGAGVVLLERLSAARAAGHRVLAVVRGSAINSDGASNGLTAPNGVAQQRVIRSALASAGLAPGDVDAVEAHGTGTVLGDPIEAEALLEVYGGDRATPLSLGSSKSVLGHSQAAAGIAGLLTMVQAFANEELPATRGVDAPSPFIDWERGAVVLRTEAQPWPRTDRPRRAGVSSFGISGTNAHVIIEEPPVLGDVAATPAPVAGSLEPWAYSATDADRLEALAERLTDLPNAETAGIAAALARRPALAHRAVLDGTTRTPIARGVVSAGGGGTVFVFPGQGAQWVGMGAELLSAGGVFAERLTECSAAVVAAGGPDVVAVLAGGGDLDDVAVVQPVSWAVMVALAAVWESVGVLPSVVVGHSQGEIAAAVVSGALSVAEGARVVVSRATALRSLAGSGAMASIGEPEERALARIAACGVESEVGVAVVNSPGSVVVSGPVRAVQVVVDSAVADEVRARVLPVDYASHSPMVEGLEFESVETATPRVRWLSTVDCAWVEEALPGEYWERNLRLPVRFGEAVLLLVDNGFRHFLEMSAHPVLVGPVEEVAESAGADEVATVGSLRRDEGGWDRLVESFAQAWVRGVGVDWTRVVGVPGVMPAAIPTYPFHRTHYWALPEEVTGPAPVADPVSAELWAAVDNDDVTAFSAALDVDPQATLEQILPRLADWRARRADEQRTESWRYRVDWQRLADPGQKHAGGQGGARAGDQGGAYAGGQGGARAGGRGGVHAGGRGGVHAGDQGGVLAGDQGGVLAGDRGGVDAGEQGGKRDGSLGGVGAGHWLLLVPEASDGDEIDSVATPLAAVTGAAVHRVVAGEAAERLAEVVRVERPDVVVSLLGLRRTGGASAVSPVLAETVGVVRALASVGGEARLWCVTRGAAAVTEALDGTAVLDGGPDPYAAQLWGLGRVAALEYPDRWGGLIDLPVISVPPVDPEAEAEVWARRIVGAVTRGDGEDQVALRDEGVFGRRLCRLEAIEPGEDRPRQLRGTALVTGGTGALGAHVARWLAGAGDITHIVLTSRRGADAPGADELRASVEALGPRVSFVACDIADPAAAVELVERYQPSVVVHAAGAMTLTPLTDITPEQLDDVLIAKVAGAENLDAALGDRPLDAFVLFSSISAWWGVADHGSYAAANAHLDALAERRRAMGRTVLSIGWGPWSGGGMIAASLGETLARRGVPLIDPEPAILALQRALDRDDPVIALAEVNWENFVSVFTTSRPSHLFDEVPEARAVLAAATATSGPDTEAQGTAVARRIAAATVDEAERLALELVTGELATVLGHATADAIDPARAFSEIGVDSLGAVNLRRALRDATGATMATTVVFDHPTPQRLARWLVGRLRPADSGVAVADSGSGAAAVLDDPVVVVSAACRFPGGVESPEALWDIVSRGGDVTSGFPVDRGWPSGLFSVDPEAVGRSTVDRGGFVTGASEFDAGFFGISPREALAMDPQQRLLLLCAWEAFERAGIDPRSLSGSRTGVYVGMTDQDYAHLLRGDGTAEAHLATSVANSVASGRIAYVLGLEGPALTVDTACSSALVALHLAVRSLRDGECDQALVGGAMIMSTPDQFIRFSRQHALAPDGRCKPFAAAADGFALSEGAAMILVERLSVAKAAGHRVLAVVRGSAVNSDGASNGLTAPSGVAQQRVVRAALEVAGLRPDDIDAVEAHGTGTALGDPIEASALLEVFGADRPEPLWIGSVKSNIGHTQTVAGLAGVIKTILAMQHEQLPPTAHVDAPSPYIDWDSGAVRLLMQGRPWPRAGRPRRAGISAFGISGTNAHVILEEPDRDLDCACGATESVGPVALPLSARDPEALAAGAGRLAAHLTEAPALPPVAAALARRTAFEERAVVLTGGARPDATQTLRALAAGEVPGDVIRGVATGSGAGVAFVFPGQGGQWVGMGAELLAAGGIFAERLTECSAAVVAAGGPDVVKILESASDLDDVAVVQPVSWAVMVALAAVWESVGVVPSVVVGHSQGEIAAAVVSGALSVAEGARIVVSRSTALRSLAGSGAMASIGEPEERALARIAACGVGSEVGVAVVNSPGSVVISGPVQAVQAVVDSAIADEVRARVLPVDYASHSPMVEGLEFESVETATPRVRWLSTVDCTWVTAGLPREYWARNLRLPVRFGEAVSLLVLNGFRHFVEMSAHPTLVGAVQEVAESAATDEVAVVGSLRRDEGGRDRLLGSFAQAWAFGMAVDWTRTTEAPGPLPAVVPTYPFHRTRYWPERATAANAAAAVPDWHHRVVWRPVPLPARPVAESAPWLILAPGDEPVRELRNALVAAGFAEPDIVTVEPGTDRAALADRLRAAARTPHSAVVSALGLRPGETADGVAAGTATAVTVVQALGDAGVDGPWWWLTRRAVSTAPSETPDAALAQLWGLGLVAGLDDPGHWGGLVDLGDLGSDLATAVAVIGTGTDEDQLAVREGRVLARRMILDTPTGDGSSWRTSGTALVTGGTGALGGHVARWLADAGAERLILTSRRGPDAPGAAELAEELGGRGVDVRIVASDLTRADDRAELEKLLAGHQVRTVVHTAGIVGTEAPLYRRTLDEVAHTVTAKVGGAEYLDALFADTDLDAFVLFSSGAATWGNAGQADYAAANAHLDALAARRRAAGRPALSVAWGAWAGGGMVDDDTAAALRNRGVRQMDPRAAVGELARLLASGAGPTAVVSDMDWARFVDVYTAVRPRHLFDDHGAVRHRSVAAEEPEQAAGKADPAAALRERLAKAVSETERTRIVVELVRRTAAAALGHDKLSAVGASRSFSDLGFESVTAVEFRNRLAAASGIRLPAGAVYDYPSSARLAAHLIDLLGPIAPATGDGAPVTVTGAFADLETALRQADGAWPDDLDTHDLAARLRALADRLTETNDAAPAVPDLEPTGGPIDADLESASGDEIFDLIDNEFGTV